MYPPSPPGLGQISREEALWVTVRPQATPHVPSKTVGVYAEPGFREAGRGCLGTAVWLVGRGLGALPRSCSAFVPIAGIACQPLLNGPLSAAAEEAAEEAVPVLA